MSATDGLEDAERFCADVVRSHDFARYASTLFVPAPQRRALLAIYAFNVEISRVREHVSQPLPGEIRMQWWTDMLAGARHAGLALGLVQVIAALPRDASRRQLFVPLQVLQGHGCDMEEVFSGKQTPSTRAAIGQLVGEANSHLETAFSLLASAPPSVRRVFLPLAVGRRDLKRMSRADSDPFVPHAASRLSILWTLWRASRKAEFGG